MPKKILLIEDNEFILDMYKIKFEQEGYIVFISENGLDGINLAKQEKPDLILLDLVMPKIDGYQVLQALKGDESTKSCLVYILSNLVQDGEVDKSFAIGADGYLIKASMTPQQLADNIKKIFAGESIGVQKKIAIKQPKTAKSITSAQAGTIAGKILLIEDEVAIIEMYKMYLEKAGFNVDTAQNGAWGLKIAKENKYDIILLDMVMPAMSGETALKQLKSEGSSKDTPVIVLSNSAQDNDIDEAKKLGAENYLIKSSITPTKLLSEINKIITTNK